MIEQRVSSGVARGLRAAWLGVQAVLVATLIAACGGGGGGAAPDTNGPGADAAPIVTEAPRALSVKAGDAAQFSVLASGSGLHFQWQRDGVDVPGALQASHTLPSAQAADHGSRWTVRVNNAAGSVTSVAARLSVLAITVAPATLEVAAGQDARFEVQATGDELVYQWQRDGVDVPAAVQASFTLPGVGAADDGSRWRVTVANAAGTLASAEARLTVRPATAAQLVRVSGLLTGPGFADGPAAEARFTQPNDIALEANGNVVVSDFGAGALRRVQVDGRVSTLAEWPGAPSSAPPLSGASLAAGLDGRLYVGGSGVLRELLPDGRAITLWQGEHGYLDGPLASARFGNVISRIAVDAAGLLHIADPENCAVRTWDRTTGQVTTRARVLPCDPGVVTSLGSVSAIAVHRSGDLVAIAGQRVLRLSPAGAVTQAYEVAAVFVELEPRLAADSAGNVYFFSRSTRSQRSNLLRMAAADGRVAAVDMDVPPREAGDSFAVAADGSLLMFDTRSALWRIPPRPGLAQVVAGGESVGVGAAIAGPFAIAADGGFWAAGRDEEGLRTLMRVSADGQARRLALTAEVEPDWAAMLAGPNGSLHLLARRPYPFVIMGLRLEPGRVYRISGSGAVSVLAGSGLLGPAADGPGSEARFVAPYGLATDATGHLLLADSDQSFSSLRRIAPDGQVSTWRSPLGLSRPEFVAMDGSGRAYVASRRDARVFRVTPADEVVVFSDTLAAKPDAVVGVTGLAVGADGTLYVAHSDNLIRRVDPGGRVTVLAGTPGQRTVRLGPLPGAVNQATDLALDASETRLYFRSEQAILSVPTRP